MTFNNKNNKRHNISLERVEDTTTTSTNTMTAIATNMEDKIIEMFLPKSSYALES